MTQRLPQAPAAPRTRTLLLAWLLSLPCLLIGASPGWAKETAPKTPPVWNGRTQAKEVATWLAAYASAPKARRAEIRTALDALGTLKPADVKRQARALLKAARKRGPMLDKKQKTFTHAGLTGRVHRQGKGRKGGVLVIALHGGGQGVGDGANALQKWGSVFGKALVLAPTAPELRGAAWNAADIQGWLLALIDAAKRTYRIDTNRVYVVGHSMGGFGSWSFGCRHADRFAGIGPCAGGVFASGRGKNARVQRGWVTNLLCTPVRFFHSTDDPRVGPGADQAAARGLEKLESDGYDFDWVYDEYDDIGHGLPKRGLKPIADWLLERTRNPYPKHILCEPMSQPRLQKDRLWWLAHPGQGRVEGKIEGNTVTVTTTGRPTRLVVYLHPELLDLKQPVTLIVDGKERHAGLVYPRLSVLLHTITTTEDPAQWYAHAVQLEGDPE